MTEDTIEVLKKEKWVHEFKGYFPKLNFSGVYLIYFPNGKWYVGSSKNLGQRLTSHLKSLINKWDSSANWYGLASKENHIPILKPMPEDPKERYDKRGHKIGNRIGEAEQKQYEEKLKEWQETNINWWELPKLNLLSIHYCRCEGYGEYEDQILKSIEDKNMWYNTQFYGNNKRGETNGIF